MKPPKEIGYNKKTQVEEYKRFIKSNYLKI